MGRRHGAALGSVAIAWLTAACTGAAPGDSAQRHPPAPSASAPLPHTARLTASSFVEPVPSPPASEATSAGRAPPGPLVARLASWERLLERDGVSVAKVAAQLGAEILPWANNQASLRLLSSPEIKAGSVALFPAGPEPYAGALYLLRITFTSSSRPRLGDLAAVFGAFDVIPRLHGERTAILSPPPRSKGWSVAVLAEASRCFDPHSSADPPPGPCEELEDATLIDRVTFRRDPRF